MSFDIEFIGNKNISQLSDITIDLPTEDINKMSSVLENIKKSVDRYKKYSNIGFFGKLFTRDIIIKAQLSISIINIELALKNGINIKKILIDQYNNLCVAQESINSIDISSDIDMIDEYIKNNGSSSNDSARLLRRRNDLESAKLLMHNNLMQFELAKNNILMLIDSFNTIENILGPALKQSSSLDKNIINSLYT